MTKKHRIFTQPQYWLTAPPVKTQSNLQRNPRAISKIYRGINIVNIFIEKQKADADEVLFNSLLDACSLVKDTDKLEATFQKMCEYGTEKSSVTLGIMVKAYGQQSVLKGSHSGNIKKSFCRARSL